MPGLSFEAAPAELAPQAVEEAASEEKTRTRANRGEAALSSAGQAVVTSTNAEAGEEDAKPKKGGWWQKRGFL